MSSPLFLSDHLLVLLLLLFPLGLLGLLLPPPRRKPVGALYWISFLGFCTSLVLFGGGLVERVISLACDHAFPRLPGLALFGVLLGMLAVVSALIANTLWGLNRARKLPEDPEEERRVAMKRISRRLWFPLVAALLLFLILSLSRLVTVRYPPLPPPSPAAPVAPVKPPPS